MYDVRCTMYDCDVRALCAEGAERMRTGCPGAMIGRGYKATVTPGGRRGLPMYDVRFINNVRVAQIFFRIINVC